MPRSLLVVTAHSPSAQPQAAIHYLARALQPGFEHVTFATVLDRSPAADAHDTMSDAGLNSTWHGMQTLTLALPHVFETAVSFARWLASLSAGDARIEPAWRRLDAAAARADVVLVQSGLAAQLLPRLRHRAPSAEIVYLAAEPGDAALTVVGPLTRTPSSVDHVLVLARSMLRRFEDLRVPAIFTPIGVDSTAREVEGSPAKGDGLHAVVPESRLFDASVLRIAALSLPEIRFHLFGTEHTQRYPANVAAHGFAPYSAMISLVSTACLGVAAYRDTADAGDLADASLDLALFDHFGIPSVCPAFATGDRPLRHGYEMGRSASLRDALRRARLQTPGAQRTPAADWSTVASVVLNARKPQAAARGETRATVEARHAG